MVRFARNEISSTMIFLSLCNILTSLLEASYSVQESAPKKERNKQKDVTKKKTITRKLKLRFLLDGFKKPFSAKAELTIKPIRIDNTIKNNETSKTKANTPENELVNSILCPRKIVSTNSTKKLKIIFITLLKSFYYPSTCSSLIK